MVPRTTRRGALHLTGSTLLGLGGGVIGRETAGEDGGDCDDGPVAAMSIEPSTPLDGGGYEVHADERVAFDAAPSTGEIASHEWSVPYRGTKRGERVAYEWDRGGGYTEARLTVTDAAGRTDSETVRLAVAGPNDRPTVDYDVAPARHLDDGLVLPPDRPITFDARASTDGDGTVDRVEWVFPRERVEGAVATRRWRRSGPLDVQVRVTDDDGATARESLLLRVAENWP